MSRDVECIQRELTTASLIFQIANRARDADLSDRDVYNILLDVVSDKAPTLLPLVTDVQPTNALSTARTQYVRISNLLYTVARVAAGGSRGIELLDGVLARLDNI